MAFAGVFSIDAQPDHPFDNHRDLHEVDERTKQHELIEVLCFGLYVCVEIVPVRQAADVCRRIQAEGSEVEFRKLALTPISDFSS